MEGVNAEEMGVRRKERSEKGFIEKERKRKK